jgi:methyl-accepting chemotaxis protein
MLKELDRRVKLRWKMIVPLVLAISFGVIATVIVTGYTTYKFALEGVAENTLNELYKTSSSFVLSFMTYPEYQKMKKEFLSKNPNIKILKPEEIKEPEARNFLKLGRPGFYRKGRVVRGIYPIVAKRECLSCHQARQGEVLGVISIQVPFQHLLEKVRKIQLLYAVLGFLGILSASVIVFITHTITHKPLHLLAKKLEQMAKGDLTIHIGFTDRVDVIGKIARSIEHVLEAFKELSNKSLNYSFKLATTLDHTFKVIDNTLEGVNKQAIQANQIAAASEEMTATISDIAKNAVNVSKLSEESMESAIKGKEFSEKAMEVITKANQSTQFLRTTIENLNARVEEIDYIVNLIKDIADQTNLLALNATIEAARAGEHGRGFAVVAEEIRKLADRTLKATEEIAGHISNIQGESRKAYENMDTTASEVEETLQVLNQVKEALDEIAETAQKVKDSITQIAAATEQQSIASEEITKNINENAKIAQEIKSLTEELAEKTYEVLLISSDLRHTAASVRTEKLKELLFDIFKGDHNRLMLRVKAHLKGLATLDPELLADYKNCSYGKWYYQGEGKQFQSEPAFKEFEKLHKECHLLSSEIVKAYNSGDQETLKTLLEKQKEMLERMEGLFEELKKIYLENLKK